MDLPPRGPLRASSCRIRISSSLLGRIFVASFFAQCPPWEAEDYDQTQPVANISRVLLNGPNPALLRGNGLPEGSGYTSHHRESRFLAGAHSIHCRPSLAGGDTFDIVCDTSGVPASLVPPGGITVPGANAGSIDSVRSFSIRPLQSGAGLRRGKESRGGGPPQPRTCCSHPCQEMASDMERYCFPPPGRTKAIRSYAFQITIGGHSPSGRPTGRWSSLSVRSALNRSEDSISNRLDLPRAR